MSFHHGIRGDVLDKKARWVLQQLARFGKAELDQEDVAWNSIRYHFLHSDSHRAVRSVIEPDEAGAIASELQVLRTVYRMRKVFGGLLCFSLQDNWNLLVADVDQWCRQHGVRTLYSSQSKGALRQPLLKLIALVDEAAPPKLRKPSFVEVEALIKAVGRARKASEGRWRPDAQLSP